MVWAGITHNYRTEVVHIPGNLNAVQYRDNILQRHVLPFLNRHDGVFWQDNAMSHVAHVCRDFLNVNNVDVLPWPARSPDLSPI